LSFKRKNKLKYSLKLDYIRNSLRLLKDKGINETMNYKVWIKEELAER